MIANLQNIIIITVSLAVSSSCMNKINSSIDNSAKINKIEVVKASMDNFESDPAQKVINAYCSLAREGKFSELKKLVELKHYNKRDTSLPKKQDVLSSQQQITKEIPDTSALSKLNYEYIISDLPKLIYEGRFSVGSMKFIENKSNIKTVKVVLNNQIDPSLDIAIIFRLFRSESEEWKIFETSFTDVK